MTDQEKAMLLSGAVNNYIFYTLFEQQNPGYTFDQEAFFNKIEKITADPMFALSPEKQAELGEVIEDLNQFKKVKQKSSSKIVDKPKLKLI